MIQFEPGFRVTQLGKITETNGVANSFQRIVARHLGVKLETVTTSTSFVFDLSVDSLDAVELLMIAEAEYNIEITDEEVEHCDKFGDAVKLIEKKLSHKEPNQ